MADIPSPSGDISVILSQKDIPPPGGPTPVASSTFEHHPPAGFWVRFGATIIDGFLIFSLMFILTSLGFLPFLFEHLLDRLSSLPLVAYTIMEIFLIVLPPLLYFSLLESSAWQATLGKRLLGLMVTDREGKRITVIRAIGRFYAKWIYLVPLGIGFIGITFGMAGGLPRSSRDTEMFLGVINPEYVPVLLFLLLGIGLLAAGFIVGKRGLHDLLAGTRVLYRTPAYRDARDLRIILAGVIACALVVISIMTVFVFLTVTAPPYDPFHHTTVAAMAERQGDAIVVTYLGGPDNDLVEGYRIRVAGSSETSPLASMTYPGPDELYPPEPGNRTRFGAGNATSTQVTMVVTMKDGQMRVVIDTNLRAGRNTSALPP